MYRLMENFDGCKGVHFEQLNNKSQAYGVFQGSYFNFAKAGDKYTLHATGYYGYQVLAQTVGGRGYFSNRTKLQSRRRFRVLLKKLIKASS